MSYTALYRKWRPLVFEDVVEQEHVVKTIKNTVESHRIGHAYLFCGTRGTGKTTMAKIFARAINCLNPKNGDPCNECEICKGIMDDIILDVVEIDAASNNSVDNVREIREGVVYAPSQASYKVYIIDEVHMLSSGAFNALLKTLEEPPKHVVFILATTDPHKLPATILSRCQRFDFKKITPNSIARRLKYITDASDIQIDSDAALLIARLADGALRDALSILDQCIAVGNTNITHQNVLDIIGIVSDDFIADIVDDIQSSNIEGLVKGVEKLSSNGRDILRFASDLVMYFRNLLICKLSKNPDDIIEADRQYIDRIKAQSELFDKMQIIGTIKALSSFEPQLKYALNQRVFLEVMLISIGSGSYGQLGDNDALLGRIETLEDMIKSGSYVVSGTGGMPKQMISDNLASNSAVASSKALFDGNVKQPIGSSEQSGGKPAAVKTQSSMTNKVPDGKIIDSLEPLAVWPDVLAGLRKNGRMMLYTYLASTRAIATDDTTVMVVFPAELTSLKANLSKPEYIEILENILNKKLSRPIRVKITDDESLEALVKASPTEKQEIVESNLLKFSREMSNKLNVPLDIIDE